MVIAEILEERVVSSRGQSKPRGVRQKTCCGRSYVAVAQKVQV